MALRRKFLACALSIVGGLYGPGATALPFSGSSPCAIASLYPERQAALAGPVSFGKKTSPPRNVVNRFPTVEGPITGGRHGWPLHCYYGDIGEVGYREEEFFISGQAARYYIDGLYTRDGMWSIHEGVGENLPYKTRMLVRTPLDPRQFNGTVVVEWINESSATDMISDPPGLQDGFVYVAITAQPDGINGTSKETANAGSDDTSGGLKVWDPERYGTLEVPGTNGSNDYWSYDIFTQVGRLLKSSPSQILRGLKVQHVIGYGISQSGTFMNSYINGVQPLVNVYDGLIPGMASGHLYPFEKQQVIRPPYESNIRVDSKIKVFTLNSETETTTYSLEVQPNTDKFRYWDVAGASHACNPQLALVRLKTDRDGVPGTGDFNGGFEGKFGFRPPVGVGSEVCWFWTLDAIIHWMHKWVNGEAEPPRITTMSPGLLRDQYGNAMNGVRLPELEVPIATYVGQGLAGATTPFTAAELNVLYPTHEDYVNKITAAAIAAEERGVILPYRVEAYIEDAKRAQVPPPLDTPPDLPPPPGLPN